MTHDEEEAQEGIRQAKYIAAHLGLEIANMTESAKVAIYSAAITYASFCAMHGVGLHQALELLMSIYKQIDRDLDDVGMMQ